MDPENLHPPPQQKQLPTIGFPRNITKWSLLGFLVISILAASIYIIILAGKIPFFGNQTPPNTPITTPKVASTSKPPVKNIDWATESKELVKEVTITNKTESSLTVLQKDGTSATYQFSPSLLIYPIPKTPTAPTKSTSNPAAITLNKKAVITLDPNNKSQVFIISYPNQSTATKK